MPDQPGNIERPVVTIDGVPVMLTCMAPEARDCLDVAMERWREFRAQMTIEPDDEVYTFAYWRLRYSGLVAPRA